MKKIISMLLICAIIVCAIPINVLASNGNHGGGGGKLKYSWRNPTKQELESLTLEQKKNISAQSVRRAFAQLGALVNGDFEKMVSGNDAYKTWLLRYIESGQMMVAEEDTNIFQLSKESIDELKNVLSDAIKEQQTFVVYKTKSADNIVPGTFTTYPLYLECVKFLRDNPYIYFTDPSKITVAGETLPIFSTNFTRIATIDTDNFIFYARDSECFSQMVDGNFSAEYSYSMYPVKYEYQALFMSAKTWERINGFPWWQIWSGSTSYIRRDDFPNYAVFNGIMPSQLYSYKGDIVPIFKDTTSAKNYLAGYSNIYMGTPRSESGAMTIPSNVNTADFDKMYSKIAEAIRDSGGKMGTSEITTMVDEEIKKMLEKMGEDIGDIEDNTAESVGLLAEIRDILKSIKNWLVANFVVNTADAVVNIIDKLFGKDGDEDVDIGKVVNSAFGDFAVLAKTKFPFSIPWDLMFIIKLLSAPPDAPVFEIPFTVDSLGYSQVIVIDFGMFRTLSNISRTFLTLLWAYVLILSTKSLIRRD